MDEPGVKADRPPSLEEALGTLKQGLIIGRIGFAEKYRRLMSSSAKSGDWEGVAAELEESSKRPQELAAVLQALDYAALRGCLTHAVDAVKATRLSGEIPPDRVQLMRAMTRVGVVYDERTMKWPPGSLASEEDILRGGTGYGPGVRIHGDINMPSTRHELIDALHRGGIDRTVLKGGKEDRLEKAPKRQLQAIYASEVRRRRGEAEGKRRLLDQI
jgi:hypothetical protein